jgi:hypothetical protein
MKEAKASWEESSDEELTKAYNELIEIAKLI